MTKTVYLSAKRQLELMEVVACASGSSSWEEVREQMSEAFHQEYGRHTDLEYEPISANARAEFCAWLENDDE